MSDGNCFELSLRRLVGHSRLLRLLSSMYLRIVCLSIGLMLSCASVLATSLPTVPRTLASRLQIDRYDMAISIEDWHWLRHKAEFRVGVSQTESAPFSVNVQDSLYEGIS